MVWGINEILSEDAEANLGKSYFTAAGASANFLNTPVSFPIANNIGNIIILTGLGITSTSMSDLYFVNRKAYLNRGRFLFKNIKVKEG